MATHLCRMKARKGARPVPGPTMMMGVDGSCGRRKSGFLWMYTRTRSPGCVNQKSREGCASQQGLIVLRRKSGSLWMCTCTRSPGCTNQQRSEGCTCQTCAAFQSHMCATFLCLMSAAFPSPMCALASCVCCHLMFVLVSYVTMTRDMQRSFATKKPGFSWIYSRARYPGCENQQRSEG